MTQPKVFFGFVAVVFIGVLIGFNFLRFPIRADELRFWPTSLGLFHDGIPSVERLRSYNELSTPLPFLIFGGLEQVFHGASRPAAGSIWRLRSPSLCSLARREGFQLDPFCR